MNEEFTYQRIVDYLRWIHIGGGYGWPGKLVGSRAATLYPNIAAELEASGSWLSDMAELANVSEEIMAAVLEDGEDLSTTEKYSLARRWEGRGPGYLTYSTLQIVDPGTNKGKRHRRELNDLMAEAAALPDPVVDKYGFSTYWRSRVKPVCEALNAGKPVTFAVWWWACNYIHEAIRAERSKAKTVRATRIAAENYSRRCTA